MKMKNLLTIAAIATLLLAFPSCKKDNNQGLNKDKIDMLPGETYRLTYDAGECVWSSQQPLIASVEDGLVTAHLVGNTTIYANEATCSVTVEPRYNTFREPLYGSDVTVKDVEKYMSDYTLLGESDAEEGIYCYISKDESSIYAYSFNGPVLEFSYVLLLDVNLDDIILFLEERYVPLDEELTGAYLTVDQQTMVGVLDDIGENMVAYINVPEGQGFPDMQSNVAKVRRLAIGR